MIRVLKKDGSIQPFEREKIESAVNKSAERVLVKLTALDFDKIIDFIKAETGDTSLIEVAKLHNIVEMAVESVNKTVASSYREYRNYKTNFVNIMDDVYRKSCDLRYRGDRENSNRDSALVSTKRSLVYGELNKSLYEKFFLTDEERQASAEGFIYIHDRQDRLSTYNCCLFDAGNVMAGGFEMGSVHYTEPKGILTACEVLGDIMFMGASQQYGGFTVSEVDKILAPYCEKTYNKYLRELEAMSAEMLSEFIGRPTSKCDYKKVIEKWALKKTLKDLEQGIQGIEVKANSVACGRGDFPFLTFTFGEDVHNEWSRHVTSAILKVRREGQGQEGKKQAMPFPKLIFLYNEDYHGEGKEYEYLFDQAIETSGSCMYPKKIGA